MVSGMAEWGSAKGFYSEGPRTGAPLDQVVKRKIASHPEVRENISLRLNSSLIMMYLTRVYIKLLWCLFQDPWVCLCSELGNYHQHKYSCLLWWALTSGKEGLSSINLQIWASAVDWVWNHMVSRCPVEVCPPVAVINCCMSLESRYGKGTKQTIESWSCAAIYIVAWFSGTFFIKKKRYLTIWRKCQ